MVGGKTLSEKISALAAYEKVMLALSMLGFSFLVIDPMVLGVARKIDPDARRFFQVLTMVGKSNWILISSGLLILLFTWMRANQIGRRRYAGYGLAQQLFMFLFATVALSGIASSLIKNILGRARPKYFDQLGSLDFQPFTFEYGFAAFPSGHATTAGALAGVLAIIWPCARAPLFIAAAWVASSRFLIGAHYFSDTVAGCAFGLAFAYFMRDRLAVRGWLFRKHEDGSIKLRGRRLLHSGSRAFMSHLDGFAGSVHERFTPDKTPRQ